MSLNLKTHPYWLKRLVSGLKVFAWDFFCHKSPVSLSFHVQVVPLSRTKCPKTSMPLEHPIPLRRGPNLNWFLDSTFISYLYIVDISYLIYCENAWGLVYRGISAMLQPRYAASFVWIFCDETGFLESLSSQWFGLCRFSTLVPRRQFFQLVKRRTCWTCSMRL